MKRCWQALTVCAIGWSALGTAYAQGGVQPQAPPKGALPLTPEEKQALEERKKRGVPDEAEEHEHAPRNANETFLDYLWRASDAAFHKGDYEKAIKIHRSIQIIDPSDTESYSIAAWLTWSLGRGEEAVKIIDQGIKANPQNSEMWDVAGQHFILQKLSVRSRDSFVKAVELSTPEELKTRDGMMLRRRLAHANEKTGDLENSATVWRSLVADFPDDVVNKNNLARVDNLIKEGKKIARNSGTVALGGVMLAAVSLSLFGTMRSRH